MEKEKTPKKNFKMKRMRIFFNADEKFKLIRDLGIFRWYRNLTRDFLNQYRDEYIIAKKHLDEKWEKIIGIGLNNNMCHVKINNVNLFLYSTVTHLTKFKLS